MSRDEAQKIIVRPKKLNQKSQDNLLFIKSLKIIPSCFLINTPKI